MPMFLASTTFMLEIFVFSAGLLVLHHSRKDPATLVKFAAYVMIAGGLLAAICTSFYSLKYWGQGDFDRAHPPMSMSMMNQGGQMPMMNLDGDPDHHGMSK